MKLGGVDIAIIALYVLGFLVIGAIYTKKVSSTKDFTTASHQMTTWVIAGSSIATMMGGTILFGNYQLVHQYGITGLTMAASFYLGWWILVLLTRKLRSSDATSIPSWLELRYNVNTRKIAAVFVIVNCIANSSAQFMAFGVVMESLGICNKTTGTIVGAVIIACYTVFSGLMGIAVTDTLQSVLLIVGCTAIIPVLVFRTGGGIDFVFQNTAANDLSFVANMAPLSLFGYCLADFLSAGSNACNAQRIFGAKDERSAIRGQIIGCTVATIVMAIACVPALCIKFIYPEMTDGAMFIPTFVAQYVPVGLKGIIIALILGLLLTTGDSYLLLLTSTAIDDFVRPAKPNLDDKTMMRITRILIVAATGVMLLLTLRIRSIYQLFNFAGGAYAAAVFVPLILGCFWKKAETKAVNIGMLISGVVYCVWDLTLKEVTGIYGIIIAILLCLVIIIPGSLIIRRQKAARLSSQ